MDMRAGIVYRKTFHDCKLPELPPADGDSSPTQWICPECFTNWYLDWHPRTFTTSRRVWWYPLPLYSYETKWVCKWRTLKRTFEWKPVD